MKAVVIISPNSISVEEVPEPVMGKYDALCDVAAAGVCSGTDNHILENDPYHKVQYPLVLGHEGIGKVTDTGSHVKNFNKGDLVTRVFNKLPNDSSYHLQWGAFSERAIVTDWQAMRDDGLPESTWKEFRVHRVLPKNFDPIASVMIITWRETYSFFKQMNLTNKQNVLIIGSGANALAFSDHCRNTGVTFYVLGSKDRKQEFIKAGAKDYYAYQDSGVYETIKSSGIKFDAIIDAIGKSNTVNKVINLLINNGTIAIYGLDHYLDYNIDKTLAPKNFTKLLAEDYDESSVHDDIVNFIKEGKLNAWDYISKEHIYPLEQARDALIATKERKVLKSVITP